MSKGTYFVDTSALFKRYIDEAGTDKIDLLFEKGDTLIISSLTIIEFVSNLKRLVDIDKVIDIDVYSGIKGEFFKDIADGIIRIEPVSSFDIIASVDLINKRYITPIDSLQLATVLKLKEGSGDIILVCSDKKLCALAEKEGIKAIWIG